MRYELSALIATADVLAGVCQRHHCARLVALDAADLALVPVTGELLLVLHPAGHHTSPETGFHQLSAGLEANLVACSRDGPIA